MAFVKKITRSGQSKILTLGNEIADLLGLEFDDEVSIEVFGDAMVMRRRAATEPSVLALARALIATEYLPSNTGTGKHLTKLMTMLESYDELHLRDIAAGLGISHNNTNQVLKVAMMQKLICRPRAAVYALMPAAYRTWHPDSEWLEDET